MTYLQQLIRTLFTLFFLSSCASTQLGGVHVHHPKPMGSPEKSILGRNVLPVIPKIPRIGIGIGVPHPKIEGTLPAMNNPEGDPINPIPSSRDMAHMPSLPNFDFSTDFFGSIDLGLSMYRGAYSVIRIPTQGLAQEWTLSLSPAFYYGGSCDKPYKKCNLYNYNLSTILTWDGNPFGIASFFTYGGVGFNFYKTVMKTEYSEQLYKKINRVPNILLGFGTKFYLIDFTVEGAVTRLKERDGRVDYVKTFSLLGSFALFD